MQEHAGWVAALMLGAWGWLLRAILGRHLKAVDEINRSMHRIDRRLSVIEGRFKQQDADATGGD